MARPLRIEFPGAVYHITSRGNERKAIFHDDHDREEFLNIIHRVTVRYNWLCHAYCLMDNHYHLIIETPDANLSIGMRQLNGLYTQMFNKRYERVGHLFQGRFRGIVVQKNSHLLEACRYVVLNPVRAKIVQVPGQWKWSSYLATSGQKKGHPCLTVDWILGQFASERKTAEAAYRKFVKEGISADPIWIDLRAQVILGKDAFVEELTEYVKGRETIAEISKSQRFMHRPTLESLFNEDAIKDRHYRDNLIVDAVLKHGYTQKEVSAHLGMHFTSISRIMRLKAKC